MEREIKFRAWDKDSSEMIYSTDKKDDLYFDFNSYGMNLMLPVEDNYPEVRECFIMQYIGLQDKDRKEIYHGDIINDGRDRNWQIIWHDGGFWYELIEPKKKQFDGRIGNLKTRCQKYLMEMCEVIGNIYENPNLLTNQ